MPSQSVWKLKGTLFFFHASMTIMVSYLPVYFQFLGLTPTEIGILLAVGPAAAIIAQPFWGFMSDKWKTVKKVLLLCLAGTLGIGFILFQLSHFLLIIPVIYIFFSFLSPAGGLGDSLAQKVSMEKGVSFGSIRMWGSLGFGSASLAGGYLLSWIGIQHIYAVFAVFIVMAFIFAAMAPDSTPSRKPVKLESTKQLIKDKQLVLFLMFVFSISLTHRINDTFIGLYIVDLGADESVIGMAWFIGVFTEAFVFATSVYWMRKFHPLTLIVIAASVYTIRWGLMWFAPNASFILAIQATHGIAFGIFYLTAFQFVTTLVPRELTSTGHLLFISVFFGFSGVVGSSFGGIIVDLFDLKTLYGIMAGLAALGVVGALLYRKYYINLQNSRIAS
ncbi:MFS transporter [Alkalicoccus daliensis]|uniref:MFS transporter, PPP family, 3-phenylpropionic acid transporter n=1 Tax=Alkalicoccus daliensis TaxID=745820 RepID=A0A1H0ADT2_9BACI|nr:MFS transporter [Alkalicoccus daliensis]SDN31719.1 MFS transporter, PPP family, 3-phenylpropionic acid transporter [Alkalicoccus daliensis]